MKALNDYDENVFRGKTLAILKNNDGWLLCEHTSCDMFLWIAKADSLEELEMYCDLHGLEFETLTTST